MLQNLEDHSTQNKPKREEPAQSSKLDALEAEQLEALPPHMEPLRRMLQAAVAQAATAAGLPGAQRCSQAAERLAAASAARAAAGAAEGAGGRTA